jgi:hypothetical protein
MILRHPVQQRKRHQHRLIPVTANEFLGHTGILKARRTEPFTRQPPRIPAAEVLSLDLFA